MTFTRSRVRAGVLVAQPMAASAGRAPEVVALVAVTVAMRLSGNELLAAVAGLVVVAVGRWAGL